MTDQEYYENPDVWGDAKFVSLKDVIDSIIITADDDSYFKHCERHIARIHGKLGLKKFNVAIQSQNKAISISVPASKIFAFPRYMTNWSRVSVLNKCKKLHELSISNRPTIEDYLQDHSAELLYDCNGSILQGNDFNAEQGDCCIPIQCDYYVCNCTHECNCNDCIDDDRFNNSWVKENIQGSYFEFSDDLVDEVVVIEFQCAGLDDLDDCDIKVDHRLELTLMRWIQWNLLLGQKNTPERTALLYKKLYKAERAESENLLGNKTSISDILKSVSLRY